LNLSNGNRRDDAAERQVLSVRQVNDAISDAIDQAFPRTIWVRGEVQRFPHDAAQRKHLYFELQETGGSGAAEYQVAVALMGWDRQRYGLSRYVDGTDPDFQIANKMEVCLECKVDFYAKFGKISLKILGVDKTFALGKLEARRREILAFLADRGLMDRNASVAMPELPLKIGLITSVESAAHHDFMTGIAASGWAFDVTLRGAKMQGELLQAEVIAALNSLLSAGVDVVVITRGGGSRADLSWFDQRDLAVAVAECPVPVITAIGHEIDTSIADLVSHQSCKTPTAAAEFLVDIIDQAARRLDVATEQLITVTTGSLENAHRRLQVTEKLFARVDGILIRAQMDVQNQAGRLLHRVSGSLFQSRIGLEQLANRLNMGSNRLIVRNKGRLQGVAPRLQRAVSGGLAVQHRDLDLQQGRLVRVTAKLTDNSGQKLKRLEDKARLLDPARLLARGYSLTTDKKGRTITGIGQVAAGETIVTRVADGVLRSIVQPDSSQGKQKPTKAKGKNRGNKQKETGQKSLFR
jgi:exodeoxyribonuclease VII large subunit